MDVTPTTAAFRSSGLTCSGLPRLAALLLIIFGSTAAQAAERLYQASWFETSHPDTAMDMLTRIAGAGRVKTALATDDLLIDGLNSDYQQVEINGITVQSSANSLHRLLDRIPFSEVQAIEVRRNPGYDSDFGGGAAATINVILKQSERQQLDVGWLPATSDQRSNHSGSLHLARGADEHWQLAASKTQLSDTVSGYFTDDSRRRWQQQREQQDLFLRAGYRGMRNARASWAANLLYLQGRRQFQQNALPLSLRFNVHEPDLGASDYDSHNAMLLWNLQTSINWDTIKSRLMLSGQQTTEDVNSDFFDDSNRQHRYKLEWRIRETWDEHRWSGSASWLIRKMSSRLSNPQQPDSQVQSLSLLENRLSGHLADHWQVTPDTRLTVGLRVDSYELKQQNQSGSDSDIATGTAWLPNSTLEYQLDDRESIALSIGQSVKPIPAVDRIEHQVRGSGSTTWLGNPDLDDEITTQSRIEYRRRFQPDQPAHHYGFTLAVSQRLISRALYYEFERSSQNNTGMTTITPNNSDQPTVIRAISASYESRPEVFGVPFTLALSGSLFKTEVQHESEINGSNRSRISQTPDSQWKLSLSHWFNRRLNAGVSWQHQGQSRQIANGDDGEVSIHTSRTGRFQGHLHWGQERGWYSALKFTYQRGERYQSDEANFTVDANPGWHWSLNGGWQY